jgi:hypothetical protein
VGIRASKRKADRTPRSRHLASTGTLPKKARTRSTASPHSLRILRAQWNALLPSFDTGFSCCRRFWRSSLSVRLRSYSWRRTAWSGSLLARASLIFCSRRSSHWRFALLATLRPPTPSDRVMLKRVAKYVLVEQHQWQGAAGRLGAWTRQQLLRHNFSGRCRKIRDSVSIFNQRNPDDSCLPWRNQRRHSTMSTDQGRQRQSLRHDTRTKPPLCRTVSLRTAASRVQLFVCGTQKVFQRLLLSQHFWQPTSLTRTENSHSRTRQPRTARRASICCPTDGSCFCRRCNSVAR